MALALVGIVLASQERHDDRARAADARRAVGLALVAALGFGTLLALLEPASREGVAWPLLAVRLGSVLVLGAIVAAARPALGGAFRLHALPALAVVGLFDTAANALYAEATTRGLLSVVSVLGSLYPVTTVLLARALLGERVRTVQEVGVVAVLGGVALIAAG
jgi:drug/metabolite transporter (DMT)-like permease